MKCPVCDVTLLPLLGRAGHVCPRNHYSVERRGTFRTTRVGAFLFHDRTDTRRPAHFQKLIDAAIEHQRHEITQPNQTTTP